MSNFFSRLKIFPEEVKTKISNSSDAKQSIRNSIWSVADYIVLPILKLATIPFLFFTLGKEQYGIWMFVAAITGSVAVPSMGLGDAIIKYVSHGLGKKDFKEVKDVVNSALMIYTIFGFILASLIILISPAIVRLFKIEGQYQRLSISALEVGMALLIVQCIEAVLLATLKGHQRYDIVAKVSIPIKILNIVLTLIVVFFGYGIIQILLVSIGSTFLSIIIQGIIIKKVYPYITFYPILDLKTIRRIFNFGVFSWIQLIGGIMFDQADRIIITSTLGVGSLAYYTICVQLAQQIHLIPVSLLSFIFPLTSNKKETGDSEKSRKIFKYAMAANILLSVFMAMFLIIFGKIILTVWMGAAFAAESHSLLIILSIAFLLLSLNTVPHYTLLGLGKIKFVSITNFLGGIISLAAMLIFIPVFGINGAAMGRILYTPAIYLNYFKVKSLLK